MAKPKNLLLIFTRNPALGKVKKRLAVRTGDKLALDIYNFLLRHTASVTGNLQVDKEVWYTENIETEDVWNEETYRKKIQKGKDLGQRMEHAFKSGFEQGYQNIIIIGSDLYDLDQNDLEKAFHSLEENPYVIGPAQDGGYYLLGMKKLNPVIFKNKSWGTSSVLEKTLKEIDNKPVILLEPRNDIDHFQDIEAHPAFQHFLN